LRSVDSPKERFKRDDSKVHSFELEFSEVTTGPKGQLEGLKSSLEYLEGAAGPKENNSRD
jgi:hypothetical protein